ncbi:DUF1127 domain-containing protein [Roseomonas sp. CCTCC AB2023176]|uniref:DUF1127 domain-containing protein n=1 Tax=Roseomonas sp. CCTCC AB2023176 TaxID=3342640 RepID=UPI0035DC5700
MSHLPSRSALVAALPRSSAINGNPAPCPIRWLLARLAQIRTAQVLASLDERLLKDIGMTRAGQPAPPADGWR